jgi:hypothetical protein
MKQDPRPRLMAKVEVTPTCWLWRGHIMRLGYGVAWFEDRQQPAHRAIYALLRGPVPTGMELDHLCRVRSCVNPEHLEVVTHRENTLRGSSIVAVQARKTHCKRGHPLSGENLSIRKDGGRECLACRKVHQRLRVERRVNERGRAA